MKDNGKKERMNYTKSTCLQWIIISLTKRERERNTNNCLPWIITVVSESERADAQALVHPEHAEARPDGEPGLHRDQARDLPARVRRYQL